MRDEKQTSSELNVKIKKHAAQTQIKIKLTASEGHCGTIVTATLYLQSDTYSPPDRQPRPREPLCEPANIQNQKTLG